MTTPLEDAQTMVSAYLAAEKQLLLGKEVRMGGPGLDRWLRLEDLPEIRAGRKEWEARATALQASTSATPTFAGLRYSLADFSGN
jgi:hypothetical protein